MIVNDSKDTARRLRVRAELLEQQASAEIQHGNVAVADRLRRTAKMLREGALELDIGCWGNLW
jgi:hypothetical protein